MQRNTRSAEYTLWLAVIDNALKDLNNENRYIRRSAHNWFFDPSLDYQWVCALVDLEPEYLRQIAKKSIKPRKESRHDGLDDVLELLHNTNTPKARALEKAIRNYMFKNQPRKEYQNKN